LEDILKLIKPRHHAFSARLRRNGNEYRYNLPGPDLTGTRLVKVLNAFAPGVQQLVVVTTSASGALTKPLQHAQRLLLQGEHPWRRPHQGAAHAARDPQAGDP
jgi:hypothetical protein